MCQGCGKSGHTTLNCWHRFDHSYQTYQQLPTTYVVAPNPRFDAQWYTDIGATHHLTNKFQNMNLHAQPYQGQDHIKIRDGSGLPIAHVGASRFSFPILLFLLKQCYMYPMQVKNW